MKKTRGSNHPNRIDPFSTPARRRRIIADFVKPTLRHYYLTACYNVYRYRIETASSIVIQCSLRQYQARQRRRWLLYQRSCHAAVIIQSQWRRQLAYWLAIRLRKERYRRQCQRLAKVVQSLYERRKQRQQVRHHASQQIQSIYRQYQAYHIVKMLKYQRQLRRYWNQDRASRVIQCHLRGYQIRCQYQDYRKKLQERRRVHAREVIQKHVLLWWSNVKYKKKQQQEEWLRRKQREEHHAEWLRLQQLRQLQQEQEERLLLAKAILAAECIQSTYRRYRQRCYNRSISWLVNQMVEDVVREEIQVVVRNELARPIYQTWHLSMRVSKVLDSSEEVLRWCLDEQVLQYSDETQEEADEDEEEDRLTIGPLLYYLYSHLLSSEDLHDIECEEEEEEESRLTVRTMTLPDSLSCTDHSSLSSLPFSSTLSYQTEIFIQHSHDDYSNYLITLSSVHEVASQAIKPVLCLLLVVPNNYSLIHHEHHKVVASVDIFLPALYSRDRTCTVLMGEEEKEKVGWLVTPPVTSASSLLVEEELDRQRKWQDDDDHRGRHGEERKTIRFRLLRPTLHNISHEEDDVMEAMEEKVVDYDAAVRPIQRCIRSFLIYRRHLHALEEAEARRRHELAQRQIAAYIIQRMWMRYRRVFIWQELCYTLLSKGHHAAVVIQCMYRRILARRIYQRLYEEEHRAYGHDFFANSEEENRRAFGLDFVSQTFSNEFVKEPLLVCPALTLSVSSGGRPSRNGGRRSKDGKTEEEEEGQDEQKKNSLPRKMSHLTSSMNVRNTEGNGDGDSERKRSLVISQNPTIEALQFMHFPLLPPRDQLVLPQQHDYLFAWKALLPDDPQDHGPSPFIFDLNASLPSASTTVYPIFSMEEMGIITEDSCLTLREQIQEVYLDEETRLANESRWCSSVQGEEEEGGSNGLGLSALYQNLIEKDWRYSPSVPSSQV